MTEQRASASLAASAPTSTVPMRSRRRKLSGLIVPAAIAAVALIVSSCYYGPDPSISHTEMATRSQDGIGPWGGMTPWFCESQGAGGAHGGHDGGLANPAYAGKQKGKLSPADCLAAADFFDKAWNAVKPYATRGAAKAAGGSQSVQFVPGLGTHDIVPVLSQTGFDPAHPLFLQYDGAGDDAKLAGMSWFVINGDEVNPPEGLPGDNDWWHTHSTLCFSGKGTVIGNEVTEAECTAKGGTLKRLPGVWMLHAWIVPGYENQRDVFSGAFMCVRGTGPLTPDDWEDPCMDDATDPEHSNHPTTTTVPATTTLPGTTVVTTTPSTDGHGHTDDDHANMTTTTSAPTTPSTDGHGHTDTDHANMTTTTAGAPATTVPAPTTTAAHNH